MFRGNALRTGYFGTSYELNNVKPYLQNEYRLEPLYPNPFNPTTTISYSISNAEHVMIEVYDIRGRLIDKIISGFQPVGNYSVKWDASKFTSGVYIISMEAGIFRENRKVLMIK